MSEQEESREDLVREVETLRNRVEELGEELRASELRAERERRESEVRLRAFMNAAPLSFGIYDSELNLLDINETGLGWWPKGTGKEQLVGKNLKELAPKLEETGRYDLYMDVLRTGEPFYAADIVPHSKFGDIHLEVRAFKVGDGFGMITSNITEKRRAEEALQRSEARFRSVFDSELTGILFWDASGNISDANDVFLKTVGYSREDLDTGGLRWPEITPPEFAQQDEEMLKELAEGKSPPPIEKEYIRKDGSRVPILLGAVVLPGPEIGGVCFVQDITDRKQAEDALRESQARLAKESIAVAAIVNGILRGELDDTETERLVMDACLTATESEYGMIGAVNEHGKYDTTTYSGRTLEHCAFPDALTWELSTGMTIRGIWGRPMLRGEPFVCNDLSAHPDRVGLPEGHVPIHCFLGVPLKREGDVTGMVAVANKPGGYSHADLETLGRPAAVMSVSRRHREALKRAETTGAELQQRSAELEDANKELESFVYSVSHDLRSPLRAVDGFSKAVQEDYGGALDEEGKDSLDRIRTGAQRMGQLIDDLLRLSRLSSAKMRFRDVDLRALAEGIADELRGAEPDRNVEVTVAKGLEARGDRPLLHIALQNLIGNAWKFTSARARARVEVGCDEADGEQVFFVRDDGAGFDMEYADKLFGPFQRLHRTDEFPGSGVGLATVQRIVHRHGGRVWAEGAVEKGATFYFSLPAERVGEGD